MPTTTTGHLAEALKWRARNLSKSDPLYPYRHLVVADSFRRFPNLWTEQWEQTAYIVGPLAWTEPWDFTGYDAGTQQWLEQWAFTGFEPGPQKWNELWDFIGYAIGSQQWLELWAFTGFDIGPQEWLEQWSFTGYEPHTLQWTEGWQFTEYFPNQQQWLEQWTAVPYSYEGTSGMTLTGTAGTSYSPRLYTGTGGLTTSGAATTLFVPVNIYVYSTTGGIIIAGTANTAETDTYNGTGGLTISGAAITSVSQSFSYIATGMMAALGTAELSKTKVFTATGGMTTGGAGTTNVTPRYYDGTGDVITGGIATTQYVSAVITVPIDLIELGIGTDNTGTNNSSAYVGYEVSGAIQTTGTPKVSSMKLNFVSTSNTFWTFNFQIPSDYTSGGTLRGKFKMATAITGNVQWRTGQVSTIDLSTNDNNLVFTASDTTGAISVPGTLGQTQEFTIPLTATNMIANRKLVLFIGRDISVVSNASGEAQIISLTFEYN